MLRCFWDESGFSRDPAHEYIVLAGLVARSEGWGRFEAAWSSALADFGLTYFHAKECEHNQRVFRDKSVWTIHRKAALKERLVAAISAAQANTRGVVLHLAPWRAMELDARRFFFDPWYPCMQECVRHAAYMAEEWDLPIEMVFSQHKEFQPRAASLWGVLREGSWPGCRRLGEFRMADPKACAPLQAADLLAYETRRGIANLRAKSTGRDMLAAVLRAAPGVVVSINDSRLRAQVAYATLMNHRETAARHGLPHPEIG